MTTFNLRVGSATDVGQLRKINQDAIVVDGGIFGVADGMGGHQGGEVASAVAVEVLGRGMEAPTPSGFEAAVKAANLAVYEQGQARDDLAGMGTTLVAIAEIDVDDEAHLVIVNVGDSRGYLLRDRNLVRITEDHSLVADLVRAGRITAEEAETHPRRNIVTRVLGLDENVRVDQFAVLPFEGDRFLMCSDGLTNEVSETDITATLVRVDDPTEAANTLVRMANEAGGRDNISVVIVDVLDDDGQAVRASVAIADEPSSLESTDELTDLADDEAEASDEPQDAQEPDALDALGELRTAGVIGAVGAMSAANAAGAAGADGPDDPGPGDEPWVPEPGWLDEDDEIDVGDDPADEVDPTEESDSAVDELESEPVTEADASRAGDPSDDETDPDDHDTEADDPDDHDTEANPDTKADASRTGDPSDDETDPDDHDTEADEEDHEDATDEIAAPTADPDTKADTDDEDTETDADEDTDDEASPRRGAAATAAIAAAALAGSETREAAGVTIAADRAGTTKPEASHAPEPDAAADDKLSRRQRKKQAKTEAATGAAAATDGDAPTTSSVDDLAGFGRALDDSQLADAETSVADDDDLDDLIPTRRRFSWRVAAFLFLFCAVIGVAVGALGVYARGTYYVGYDDNRVAIFQGRPGGVLFFDPTVEAHSNVIRAELLPVSADKVDDDPDFGTFGEAQVFITNLQLVDVDTLPVTGEPGSFDGAAEPPATPSTTDIPLPPEAPTPAGSPDTTAG